MIIYYNTDTEFVVVQKNGLQRFHDRHYNTCKIGQKVILKLIFDKIFIFSKYLSKMGKNIFLSFSL